MRSVGQPWFPQLGLEEGVRGRGTYRASERRVGIGGAEGLDIERVGEVLEFHAHAV